MLLAEPPGLLLGRQPLLLAGGVALLAVKGCIKERLRLAVSEHQRQAFETQYVRMGYMGVYLADALGFAAWLVQELHCLAGLRQVGVISNQTAHTAVFLRRVLMLLTIGLLVGNNPQQLAVHRVENLAPVHQVAVQEVIEHVLLATVEAAKRAGLILEGVLYAEERKHQQKA